jgi:hypothetical protein
MPGSISLVTAIGAGSQSVSFDTATTTGNWIDVSELEVPYTVHIRAAGAGDTYQVYGSCEDPQPANATDGIAVGSVLNAANATLSITTPYRWLKAKKTAHTTNTQPWLFGVRRK